MNKPLQKSRASRNRASQPPFQIGQVWEMADSTLQIGLVGKTLVHYKHYKGKTKRAPISLAGIKVLEKFLKENKATLIRG